MSAPGRRLDWGGSPQCTRDTTSVTVSERGGSYGHSHRVQIPFREGREQRRARSRRGAWRVEYSGQRIRHAPVRRGALLRGALSVLAPVLAGMAMLLFWQLSVQLSGVSTYLVPEPAAVLQSFLASVGDGMIPRYAATTLVESLAASLLGR